MTMINRVAPAAAPLVALTDVEIQVLDRLLPSKIEPRKATLSTYLVKIARLGGYLKPDQGFSTRQHSHVARIVAAYGY